MSRSDKDKSIDSGSSVSDIIEIHRSKILPGRVDWQPVITNAHGSGTDATTITLTTPANITSASITLTPLTRMKVMFIAQFAVLESDITGGNFFIGGMTITPTPISSSIIETSWRGTANGELTTIPLIATAQLERDIAYTAQLTGRVSAAGGTVFSVGSASGARQSGITAIRVLDDNFLLKRM